MAKKKKSRKRPQRKIPLGITMGFSAMVLGKGTLTSLRQGNFNNAFNQASKNIIGFDPGDGSFNWARIQWQPMVAGLVISMVLGRLVNRRLNIPYIKL